MTDLIRLGCVPYLNAKPLIDWFEADDGARKLELGVDLIYDTPSSLARLLNAQKLDCALVSIFEWFQNPSLSVVPDISISADGAVKSVRLFSKVPIEQIESVALDTSSLTSSALTKIVLSETYDVTPTYVDSPPNLNDMLSKCDAGLIIGDLGLFHSPVRKVLDLGSEWKNLTGMPFCYAAWLAQPGADLGKLHSILTAARAWGLQNVDSICTEWSVKMNLDIERVIDYLCTVMQYDLGPDKLSAVECFRDYCGKYGLMDR